MVNYPMRFTRGRHFVVKPNEPRRSFSAASHQYFLAGDDNSVPIFPNKVTGLNALGVANYIAPLNTPIVIPEEGAFELTFGITTNASFSDKVFSTGVGQGLELRHSNAGPPNEISWGALHAVNPAWGAITAGLRLDIRIVGIHRKVTSVKINGVEATDLGADPTLTIAYANIQQLCSWEGSVNNMPGTFHYLMVRTDVDNFFHFNEIAGTTISADAPSTLVATLTGTENTDWKWEIPLEE